MVWRRARVLTLYQLVTDLMLCIVDGMRKRQQSAHRDADLGTSRSVGPSFRKLVPAM